MQNVCDVCGGSGEIRYFKGHSRFLLSERTCPLCDGLGAVEEPAAGDEDAAQAQRKALYRRTFDTIAEGYDSEALRFFPDAAAYLPQWLQLGGDEQVLDVATGTGWAAAALAPALPRGRVVGIDFSENMLARARAKLGGLDNVGLRAMDMQAMDLPEAPFDAAVAAFSIFFVEDMAVQLAHMAGKVRPGGTVAITTFCATAFAPQLDWFLQLLEAYGVQPPSLAWKRVASEELCRQLFEGAGLTDVRCERRALSYPLVAGEQWWQVVWNGGFRGLVEQLEGERREAFRRQHLTDIAALGEATAPRLQVPVLYTRGTKPT